MRKVVSCFKCEIVFPDFPVMNGLHCPECGTELKIVRPISKREAQRMRLNMEVQKSALQDIVKEESEGKQ